MLDASLSVTYCEYEYGELAMSAILFFFFQAEDGIRDLVRSRGLGDVYKIQHHHRCVPPDQPADPMLHLLVTRHGRLVGRRNRVDLSLIHI